MKERTSPPLGAYHVRAFTSPADAGGWLAHGQTWLNQADGPSVLLAQVSAGPLASEQDALYQAYDHAYADTLRLILREFACF
jgi:hypothetical protein